MCKHENIHYTINRNRFEDTNLEYVEISGKCTACGADLQFRCNMIGMSPDRPTVNFGHGAIILPCTVGEEAYDGKANQGYRFRDFKSKALPHAN